MTQSTPDPVTSQETLLVRSTATGFEQAIAAMAGLFTAGPLGVLAAWGAIRGLQGKWAPWFVLGIPAAIALNIFQIALLAAIVGTSYTEDKQPIEIDQRGENQEQIIHI